MLAERAGSGLRALVDVLDHVPVGPRVVWRHPQGGDDDLVVIRSPIAPPARGRANTPTTTAQYSRPSSVPCWVISATQYISGASGANAIKARSSDIGCSRLGPTGRRFRRRCALQAELAHEAIDELPQST